MAHEDPANRPAPPPPTRLNGWKEIATYFGKGVRTVQRWEKDVGLPVHRIGTGGGEVVYAVVPELERWQESAGGKRAARESVDCDGDGIRKDAATAGPVQSAQPSTRPRTWRRALAWIGAGTGVVVLAAMAWFGLSHAPAARQPASWKIANGALKVLDADGRFLWERRFKVPLSQELYEQQIKDDYHPVYLDDIDGDGDTEVLLVSQPWSPNSEGLFCLNSNGSIRFRHTPTRRVRFGDKIYAPPWRGGQVFASGLAGQAHDIWFVSTHQEEFPTVVEKLDVSGKVRGEYWSNGQISSVVTRQLAGRLLVFVGAISNEWHGGSLAVLDANHASGAAPAASDHYPCTGCPPGAPLAFFVFPCLDVTTAIKSYSRVTNVFLDSQGQIMVDVLHDVGVDVAPELRRSAGSYYTLDSQFRVIAAELGQSLSAIHDAFERKILLDHPFSSEYDSRFLWPVRRWDGSRFVEIWTPEPRDRR